MRDRSLPNIWCWTWSPRRTSMRPRWTTCTRQPRNHLPHHRGRHRSLREAVASPKRQRKERTARLGQDRFFCSCSCCLYIYIYNSEDRFPTCRRVLDIFPRDQYFREKRARRPQRPKKLREVRRINQRSRRKNGPVRKRKQKKIHLKRKHWRKPKSKERRKQMTPKRQAKSWQTARYCEALHQCAQSQHVKLHDTPCANSARPSPWWPQNSILGRIWSPIWSMRSGPSTCACWISY